MTSAAALATRPHAFRHDALFYDGAEQFHAGVSAFIADAVDAGEPVLVVASADKIDRLGKVASSDMVELADMAEVGRNPGRIIPAWRAFVDAHPSATVRGVGEPIPPDRHADEIDEYQHLEALLNVAFAAADAFWLRCPYDVGALDHAVVEGARRTHPFVVEGDRDGASATYLGTDGVPAVLDTPLPEPPDTAGGFTLRPGRLDQLRSFVRDRALAAGLGPRRADDLVLAVNEVASNSLLYAGGGADVRIWQDRALVCEVHDTGVMTDPLIGRLIPGVEEHDTRGIWIVNQVCDFVQVRSSPDGGTVVRLHVR